MNLTLQTLTDTDLTTSPDTINVNASDSLGGTAGQQQIAMTVNSKPVLSLFGGQTISANKLTAVNTSGSIGESGNTTGESFSVTLSDSHGLLSVTNANGAGITNNDTTSVTISGTLTQVNAALGTIDDDNATTGSDPIVVSATDAFGSQPAIRQRWYYGDQWSDHYRAHDRDGRCQSLGECVGGQYH